MQHVNYAGATNALWIINAGILKVGVLTQLLRSLAREVQHVFFTAEVQAARRARFDARRFQAFAHAVRAQCALEHAISLRIHLWNVERASRNAVAAPDAIGLLKIDDAVGVLHDSPVRGTCRQAPRLRAMHALILAHQPHQRAVFAFVLVEENQVPVIPARLRHRLVGVAENRFSKRQVVPLHARHLACLAANACSCINEFADGILALRVFAGNAPGVAGDFLNAQYFLAHGALYALSSFTRKPLNSGV